MQLDRIDHLVLTVASLKTTVEFYARFGMQAVFANDRYALHFGQQKINLHEKGKEFTPHAEPPTPGSADFCLIVATPLDQVVDELRHLQIPIEIGPVERAGALGRMRSVYLRDPDRNLVELAEYL
ncbi:MAG TPA: VOC family protein [Granulicella sp.]